MPDPVDLAKILHDTPDLFPWVCLAIIMVLAYKGRHKIAEYFDARIDAYSSKKQSDAVMAELVRNNTAALNNNTAALEAVKTDRGETRKLVNYHEQLSKERNDAMHDELGHIQTVVNQINDTVSRNSENIQLIEDRTK